MQGGRSGDRHAGICCRAVRDAIMTSGLYRKTKKSRNTKVKSQKHLILIFRQRVILLVKRSIIILLKVVNMTKL